MFQENRIWVGNTLGNEGDGSTPVHILLNKANRHGLIAGATGTGKTITLKVLAESFSDAGVPVLLADVKGDISGMAKPGVSNDAVIKRLEAFDLVQKGFDFSSYPTEFWDIFGENGLPLRTTISEFGPLLLARLLGLNQTQTDILNIVFKIADDEDLLLIDIKDLKALLNYVSENTFVFKEQYGNLAPQSISAIMRGLVSLGDRGGDVYFGEPALDIMDWFMQDSDNRGVINILDASSLIHDSSAYASFMLWMLAELFESLPEVGDLDKPKMVFFFDEAHLLFQGAPKPLMEKMEQVIKLIRSKGVGIFFITQNPADIPDGILAQLGNKIQHALRAYTPSEQKGIRAAAASYRSNPKFKTEDIIMELGIGEAIISVLLEDGTPSIVEKVAIMPPQSLMGPIDDASRRDIVARSVHSEKYTDVVDRDSAYEFLTRKKLEMEQERAEQLEESKRAKELAALEKERAKLEEKEEKRRKRIANSVAGTVAGTVGREVGNTLGKTVGGKFGKRLGGNLGASLGRGLLKNFFKL